MSTTLNFFDAAWASARDRAADSRSAAALPHLNALLGSPDCPRRLRLLAHRLAARLHAAVERYGRARRHLREADDLDPNNPEIHYEMGVAFEADPYGCDLRAARRFKKAVVLSAKPAYRAALGRALVRADRVRAGVKHLRMAAAATPADAAVLAVVVDGLCDAGRVALAGELVAKARFLAPADKVIRKLWDDVRFAAARKGQSRTQKATKVGAGPALLPFVRLFTADDGGTGGVVRRDAGSRPAPHFNRLQAYRTEQG